MAKYFGPNFRPPYVNKADSFKRIYEIMAEKKMGIDVVSSGAIHTVIQAGYDMSHAYFHSNNKTDEDIWYYAPTQERADIGLPPCAPGGITL